MSLLKVVGNAVQTYFVGEGAFLSVFLQSWISAAANTVK